jgi:glutathione synthase/RimK-type ligase-like ATP-grasp enzyme
LKSHGTIIAKPLRGSGSVGIQIIRSAQSLRELDLPKYILEQYLPGKEMRYLLLNNTVIAVHESRYGTSVAADRDLERISYQPNDWDAELVSLTKTICRALGLSFAGVDFIIDRQGTAFILEVNSSPGFKWFHAPSSGPKIDMAGLFLKSALAGGYHNPSPAQ